VATRASDRLVWSIDALAVSATDHLLEIGCGHGVAVSIVCERLTTGTITAIDRSEKMVTMARNRNAQHIAAGRASIEAASLHEASLNEHHYDKIFAIHVNLFRKDAERDLGIVNRLLAPGGAFYAMGQPLNPTTARTVADEIASVLTVHAFTVREIRIDEISSGTMYCVAAGID
jgi:cyclopropane fatty-acyl-phospholipid synthase-like methyltransferase